MFERFAEPLTHGVPFSFVYDGVPWAKQSDRWEVEESSVSPDSARTLTTRTFTHPASGLRVTCEATSFHDFPALDWVLYFENRGSADTPIIENVNSLDVAITDPMEDEVPYVVYHTLGGLTNQRDFATEVDPMAGIEEGQVLELSARGGLSSNKDFPFFRIDFAGGTVIIGVGWSGQWHATIGGDEPRRKRDYMQRELHVCAGMEFTHFRLHPGERVRQPRILVLFREGTEERLEANNLFRRLLLEHYVPKYRGKPHVPFLYCNTAFTRRTSAVRLGGYKHNEQSEISLIRALSPLGIEAVITDAGWFIGDLPPGAIDWVPDPEQYPRGMGPVAAAAHECGTRYGLWFEPERVIEDSVVLRRHPDWVLRHRGDDAERKRHAKSVGVLDFALPEVREYFLDIIDGLMKLPGFGCYRQDFNPDIRTHPLQWWRDNDAPDRQGITEMRYIEGLYTFWDELIRRHPDTFRVNCAGGGRRIDLETILRFHVHQKTDLHLHYHTHQNALHGLSQYVPNGIIMSALDWMDSYSFHSAMAGSICLGWRADAPEFDMARARQLADLYREVRHFLNGDWYPLTPYNRGLDAWLGSQYHRPDLDAGMLLVFRRAMCRTNTLTVALGGLDAKAAYVLTDRETEVVTEKPGEELLSAYAISLANAPSSTLITYRKA